MFWPIRLRANATKQFGKAKNGVVDVRELIKRLPNRWRRWSLAHLCASVPLSKSKLAELA
jgi:hypothetical protein